MKRLLLMLVGLMLFVTACAPSESDPSAAMMSYLQARTEADATKMQSLACAEWEDQAAIQAQSFRSMNAELQDVSCTTGAQDGDYTLVACEGNIITSYNGENRAWELGSYRMKQEDGEWKMCGEAG